MAPVPYSVLQTVMIKYWRDDPVDSPGCREWEAFVLSEPALFEGIVGVNMRHWSPAPAFQKRAEDHSSRAVSIIIDHIRSGTAHQDGVLGAVATMALSESLDRNEKSWRMHLDGLAQILEERKAWGVRSMPSWFTGFIVMYVPAPHRCCPLWLVVTDLPMQGSHEQCARISEGVQHPGGAGPGR